MQTLLRLVKGDYIALYGMAMISLAQQVTDLRLII